MLQYIICLCKTPKNQEIETLLTFWHLEFVLCLVPQSFIRRLERTNFSNKGCVPTQATLTDVLESLALCPPQLQCLLNTYPTFPAQLLKGTGEALVYTVLYTLVQSTRRDTDQWTLQTQAHGMHVYPKCGIHIRTISQRRIIWTICYYINNILLLIVVLQWYLDALYKTKALLW